MKKQNAKKPSKALHNSAIKLRKGDQVSGLAMEERERIKKLEERVKKLESNVTRKKKVK